MPATRTLPPVSTQPVSVVLLSHDSRAYLETGLHAWLDYLEARGPDHELLLVDDGKSDGAVELAEAVSAQRPMLRVVHHSSPRGEGAALRAGVAEAKKPLLFVSVLGPEYRPEHLGRMLDRTAEPPETIKEIDKTHVMGGFRAGVPMPIFLRVLGYVWRLMLRIVFSASEPPLPGWLGWRRYFGWLAMRFLFGLRYHDVACPVRLMRREIFARIPIQSDSSFAHVEVLAKANFLGLLMTEEVPLDLPPRPYRGDLLLLLRDARAVIRNPDFGTAVIKDGPDPTAAR